MGCVGFLLGFKVRDGKVALSDGENDCVSIDTAVGTSVGDRDGLAVGFLIEVGVGEVKVAHTHGEKEGKLMVITVDLPP